MIILNIIGLIVAGVVLVLSGSLLIRTVIKIAAYLRLSDFVVGFIVMAFATSSPELFIGITSAVDNVPNLSLGDILGSNFVDITIVLGLVTIFARKIQVKGKIVTRDTYLAILIALLPLLLMLDQHLSRIDGVILILAFALYIVRLWTQRKRFKTKSVSITKKEFIKNVFLFIVGMALLLISSKLIVDFSSSFAINLGVPLILIGIIIVAIGTDLPELIFEINAVSRKREGMALGNALGSVVTQGTIVLGIVALISPFTIENFQIFVVTAIFITIALALFAFLIKTKESLSWKEGLILIMLYIIFIIVELQISNM